MTDSRLTSPSPIARALAARDAGLTCEQAWRKYGGLMTWRAWRLNFGSLWDEPTAKG